MRCPDPAAKGIAGLGKFDFIYSLGLCDYLSDAAARHLLATAVDMPESNVVFLELTRA
jgi:hypothetical protein